MRACDASSFVVLSQDRFCHGGLLWFCTNCCIILLLLLLFTSVMSDSVRPHKWQPTRLPRPWDSPGKNIGVGCHFLLQCMKVKSEGEVAQLCPTLGNPMDYSPPGPPSMGFSRQEYWSGSYGKCHWNSDKDCTESLDCSE